LSAEAGSAGCSTITTGKPHENGCNRLLGHYAIVAFLTLLRRLVAEGAKSSEDSRAVFRDWDEG